MKHEQTETQVDYPMETKQKLKEIEQLLNQCRSDLEVVEVNLRESEKSFLLLSSLTPSNKKNVVH